ncbi:MAG: RagB/SusD family nutrient uptake outer membrane protein [Bacteroidaceae bacterium]|nr:RagB/SusD family nutrient uptake outer membrane protein [Bacteroidaceae bacterium]
MIKRNIKIFGLAALAGLSVSSCDLELLPLNEVVLENFWTNKDDVQSVVNACYSSMADGAVIKNMIVWGEARADNVQASERITLDKNLEYIVEGGLSETNGYCNWTSLYTVIDRCNTVLYYAPQVQKEDPNYTESDLMVNLGEARALRAMCYFYLIRTFKDVPFVTNASIDDNQDYVVPAEKHEVILDSLIADIEEVKEWVPRRYSNEKYNTAKITRNAMYALLAEMYLWRASDANLDPIKAQEYYKKCVEYSDKVIEAKIKEFEEDRYGNLRPQVNATGYTTYGYPLLSESLTSSSSTSTTAENAEAYNKIFGTGNSFESIFELSFESNLGVKNGGVSFFYGDVEDESKGGALAAYEGLMNEKPKSSDKYNTEATNIFTVYDRRGQENFTFPSGGSGDYVINKYVVDQMQTLTGPSWAPVSNLAKRGTNTANWIIYRLTDIMLMKAEAEVQIAGYLSQIADTTQVAPGKTRAAYGNVFTTAQEYYDEVFNIVSAIYYRATAPNTSNMIDQTQFTTYADYVELVEVERRRELMFEGKRYYDLVRRARREGNTGHFRTMVSGKFADNAEVMKIKMAMLDFMYMPYLESELDVNKYLTQNPAYIQDKTTVKN